MGYKVALKKFESRAKGNSPMTARENRFKSSDRKGFFGGQSNSEAGNDNTTNLSSNGHSGKLENTLDISGKADQLLFDSSKINPSFNMNQNMDQVMLDYYPEY